MFHPGFDYRRFDVEYWQKFDRLLRYARDNDMIISLVLDMNDGVVHPGSGSEDESRFIHYADGSLRRFLGHPWDLGDDLDRYRNRRWTRATGTLINELDPYHHLATSHPINNVNQERTSDWFSFTSLQEWSRHQHSFMLSQRREQGKLGELSLRQTRNMATRIITRYGPTGLDLSLPMPCAELHGILSWPAATKRRARAPGAAPMFGRTRAAA